MNFTIAVVSVVFMLMAFAYSVYEINNHPIHKN